eukprot:420374-Hanusia_phi.AAC.1
MTQTITVLRHKKLQASSTPPGRLLSPTDGSSPTLLSACAEQPRPCDLSPAPPQGAAHPVPSCQSPAGDVGVLDRQTTRTRLAAPASRSARRSSHPLVHCPPSPACSSPPSSPALSLLCPALQNIPPSCPLSLLPSSPALSPSAR